MPHDLTLTDLDRVRADQSPMAIEHHRVAPWTYLCTLNDTEDYFDEGEVHFAIHDTTSQEVTIRFHPREPMTFDDFRRWVDLGCSPWCYKDGVGMRWTSELLAEAHQTRLAQVAALRMQAERMRHGMIPRGISWILLAGAALMTIILLLTQ
ncbi:MAG: hypothetical protein ACPG4X_16355 [Pikeienuella sp.]